MGYVLGLDLGPTSVGWAGIILSEKGDFKCLAKLKDGEKEVDAIGVRHFQINIDNYGSGDSEETKKSQRRKKRLQRRMLRRKKARRLRLLKLLQENGLAPVEYNELRKLMKCDPYQLRVRALKETLQPYDIGRILLHISRRRGFKSNKKLGEPRERKEKKKNEQEGFENAKSSFEQKLNGRTPGELWYEERKKNPREPIRNRKGHYKDIAQRYHYISELTRIWEKQELPKELLDKIIKNEEEKDKDKLIFWQQTYKLSKRKRIKVIGKCKLMPGKLRCPYSNRKAQEFRMLQKINDLQPITDQQRDSLIRELSLVDSVSFDEIRKILGLHVRFNLEWKGCKELPGNKIDAQLVKIFGKKDVRNIPVEKREKIWQEIFNWSENENITDTQLADRIKNEFGLGTFDTKKLNAVSIPDGNCNFCEEILDHLLELMRKKVQYYEAIEAVCEKLGLKRPWRVLKELPVPDREHGIEITNPAVTNALQQVRRVVNTLIKDLREKPEKIVIELARDIKASKEHRKEIIDKQSRNQKERNDARGMICEIFEWPKDKAKDVSDGDVERYRLWQQQNGRCVYCGKCISPQTELFTRTIEVDHILPHSISLDNSMSNKVVCCAQCNQEKGQETPISWLEKKYEERWEKVQHLIAHWNREAKYQKIAAGLETCEGFDPKQNKIRYDGEKWERFFIPTEEIREKYQPGNLLSDTTYITTAVREYVQRLYPTRLAEEKVTTTKGGITSELRKIWGLNALIGIKENKKNRSDLRHHAIDAAITAVSEPALIKRVTDALQEAWPEKNYKKINAPKPWQNFFDDLKSAIDNTNISHKVEHKTKGQLLDEQPFGLTDEVIEEFKQGKMQRLSPRASFCAKKMPYLRRRPLDKIKYLDTIPETSLKVRAAIEAKLKENGVDKGKIPENALTDLVLKDKKGNPIPVRAIQVTEEKSNMVIITNKDGIPYKAYPSGENHHIEIFRRKDKGKYQYVCKLWTMVEIARYLAENKKDADGNSKGLSVIFKKHPDCPDAEFVMSLAKHDAVLMKNEDGEDVLARVTGISQNIPGDPKRIYLEFMPINIGDDKFLQTPEEKRKFRNEWLIQSVGGIAKRAVRKITIDYLGRVRWAEKKFWGPILGT